MTHAEDLRKLAERFNKDHDTPDARWAPASELAAPLFALASRWEKEAGEQGEEANDLCKHCGVKLERLYVCPQCSEFDQTVRPTGEAPAGFVSRADAVRLRDCLRNLTDGIGDGYGPHIEAGRAAVIAMGYLDRPLSRAPQASPAPDVRKQIILEIACHEDAGHFCYTNQCVLADRILALTSSARETAGAGPTMDDLKKIIADFLDMGDPHTDPWDGERELKLRVHAQAALTAERREGENRE